MPGNEGEPQNRQRSSRQDNQSNPHTTDIDFSSPPPKYEELTFENININNNKSVKKSTENNLESGRESVTISIEFSRNIHRNLHRNSAEFEEQLPSYTEALSIERSNSVENSNSPPIRLNQPNFNGDNQIRPCQCNRDGQA